MKKNGKNPFDFEEDFHADDERQLYRQESKRASAKDRSQFKKSDQDQLKKRETTQPELSDTIRRGRVLAINPEGVVVSCDGNRLLCSLKGALKQQSQRLKNLIAVGDLIYVECRGKEEGTILYIEPRWSILSRAEHFSRHKEQLIAVNVDQVLITCSVLVPALKPPLIDRYIIAARKGNMTPIIIVNKIDLLSQPPSTIDAQTLEKEKSLYQELLSIYPELHIPVVSVSCMTGEGIEQLKQLMCNKTSVFSGQSGVGKSSLINSTVGSTLPTGEMVTKTNKGSHTTTTTHLEPLIGGGFCVDTPGIKSFGIWDIEKEELQNYFCEIQHYAQECRYLDCAHRNEPECAVKSALEKGLISTLRFASYCALMEDLSKEHKPR